jgi:flagellar motor switch protein FliM
MSDQILTQEEIDALLTAMDRGDVDIEEDTPSKSEAVSYNLTSQNIMLRDQFSALEQVYDKFATLLNTTLSAVLQRSLEIEFVSSELVKYEECISAFSTPSSFVIFKQEPLIGSALMAMEPGLVFSLIDCMFGGTGRPTGRIREFTMIEQRMIRKVSAEILDCLEKAWQIVQPTKIELRKVETKPEYVHLVSLNDLMVVIIFSIKGKEFSGNFHLCMSYLMLEPIKEKLSSKYLREKDIANTWSREIRSLLKNTPVDLTAELGRTTQSIRNLLKLQVEDVLQLNTGPEDLIQLTIDNVPKYLGYPGVIKGNRAVEIVELLDRNGGEN